ncbi:MAG TPA: CBS domain-containing protein [Thermotogota bacterium]|nr:CBS domain-containing protein [Thermotogota bacterium]
MGKEDKRWLAKPEKIIVSHKNPDFDSFSASVAAQRLYPDHTIVVSGEGAQNLEDFFAIYKEKIPFYREESVDLSEIKETVIVDACLKERLGQSIQNAISRNKPILRIYDHHPFFDEDIFPGYQKREVVIEEIGSATTLMVEKIRKQNVEIDKIDATLFSTGIYEDTGNFLFSSTTPRDLQSSAFLLENGANLDVVSAFVKIDMTIDQKWLLEDLLTNKVVKHINQTEIAIGIANSEKFIGGLNLIVSKLWMSEGYDTFIAVVGMGKKTYIVGRTSSPDVNLGELMGALSGGGHKRAAACKLTGVPVDDALKILITYLEKYVTPAVRAKHLMSSPVRTVFANMPIQSINKIFEETGYGGLPVIEDGKLAGMIVRRDVQKAMAHLLNDKPVKSIMSTKLQVVDIEDSIEKVKAMMVENGIGRIPVLKEGVLIGIISRTDLIRASYKDERDQARFDLESPISQYDTSILLQRSIPLELTRLLKLIGETGDQLNIKTYVVGGFVRDLLLRTPNLDVDVVVEGNAIEFVKKLSARCEESPESFRIRKIEEHTPFQVAKAYFDKGYTVDFASARIETYHSPGALPVVEFSHIRKDLVRRDFSINAMAIDLGKDAFGTLLDFFRCRRDLESGSIRVLYNTSFIDDPTRILRGVRYEIRFGFAMEERTLELLKEALSEKYLERVSGGRIRREFQRSLTESALFDLFKRYGELEILKHCFPATYYTETLEAKLKRFFDRLLWVEKFFNFKGSFNRFYALLYLLLEYNTEEQLKEVETEYGVPRKVTRDIFAFSKKVELIAHMFNTESPFSDLYILLEGAKIESLAYLCAYLTEDGTNHFKEYSRLRKGVRFYYVDGMMLTKQYHLDEGSVIREVIAGMTKEKMNGLLNTAEEEKDYLDRLLSPGA